MCMPLSPVQGTWNCSQASQISNQLQQSCLPPKNGKRKGTSFTFLKSSQCMEGVQRLNYDDVVEHAYLTSNRILGDCDMLALCQAVLWYANVPPTQHTQPPGPGVYCYYVIPLTITFGGNHLIFFTSTWKLAHPGCLLTWYGFVCKHGTHKFVVYHSLL